MESLENNPSEIWARVFEAVRRELASPMVWMAMQSVRPLAVDGSFFIASLVPQESYLSEHLLDNQAATAIEDALRAVTGRILAFRLVFGDSLAEWEQQKARGAQGAEGRAAAPGEGVRAAAPSAAEPPPAFFRSDSTPPPAEPAAPGHAAGAPERAVSPTWEKLSERLNQGYKAAPFIKYPHGQAQYVLTAVKLMSDTMDVLMPPAGAARDDAQERALAKVIERFSGIVNLDSMFIALELLRYREAHGKSVDVAL